MQQKANKNQTNPIRLLFQNNLGISLKYLENSEIYMITC